MPMPTQAPPVAQPQQLFQAQTDKPKLPEKPKLTAQQLLEEKFEGWPITANEKYIMRLDQVKQVEGESPETLMQVLSALNPFSQFVLKEVMQKRESSDNWELDGTGFLGENSEGL